MPTDFNINGQIVAIENKAIALTLRGLAEEKQDLILLYYFLHVKEKDLAIMYECSGRTIRYRICETRKILREEMERIEHEEI